MTALSGLVPSSLAPAHRRIFLDGLEVATDIGFHAFEVGAPQRLLIWVDVWVDDASFPDSDRAEDAWNYDHLRTEVVRLATERRFNLQETLARAIYDQVAARAGVVALRVATAKPDIYPDCRRVGVELRSADLPRH